MRTPVRRVEHTTFDLVETHHAGLHRRRLPDSTQPRYQWGRESGAGSVLISREGILTARFAQFLDQRSAHGVPRRIDRRLMKHGYESPALGVPDKVSPRVAFFRSRMTLKGVCVVKVFRTEDGLC